MGIEFNIQTSEDDLSIDLEEFYDYVVSHELNFISEFGQQVLNFLFHSRTAEMEDDELPVIMGTYLDHDRFDSYIDIDLNSDENPWIQLGEELEAICNYAAGQQNDGHMSDQVVGYLAILADSWKWETIDAESIDERMVGFLGLYSNKWDIIEELIERGDLDPIPDWVVHDESNSAEEAEYSGHFSTYHVSWLYDAAWA